MKLSNVCPTCGEKMRYDEEAKQFVCEACGATVEVSEEETKMAEKLEAARIKDIEKQDPEYKAEKKEKRKKRTGKALFITSCILSTIGLVASIASVAMLNSAFKLMDNVNGLGEAIGMIFVLIIFLAIAIMIAIAALILLIISLASCATNIKFLTGKLKTWNFVLLGVTIFIIIALVGAWAIFTITRNGSSSTTEPETVENAVIFVRMLLHI